MKTSCFLILVAGFFLAGCKKEERPKPAASSTSEGNPITAPVDYLGALSKGQKTANKTLKAAGLQQAIQMFYAQEGRFPKDLSELATPDYLGVVPPPPFGMKYDYDPATGALKVVPK
jgi:hypothetical protein